nr:hypothetical protein [Tanacetum cinerariifolium]
MEDPDAATESSWTPSAIEKSSLDFDNKNPSPPMTEGKGNEDQAHETVALEIPLLGNMPTTGVASEVSLEEDVAAIEPRLSKKRGRGVNDGELLRKDYVFVRSEQSTRGGKSLPTMGLAAGSTFVTPADTKEPQPHPKQSITQSARHALCEKCKVREIELLPIYGWVTRRNLSTRMGSDQQLPPGHPERIPRCCRSHSAAEVAIGSQLRLRFEQEEIQGLQNQTSNLKTLMEAEADIKKVAETKNADLTKESKSLWLQVSHDQLTQQVSTLQTQVIGEERIKAAFEEFKKYEDDRVEKRCAEMDAHLDALSIDFDEELYPHMLTAIAGRRWSIGHGLRLAVMKCAESIELRAWEGRSGFGGCGSLESLKDAPIEVIMKSLHLESGSKEDAPKWIRDLRPSTSQLKIPVYLEVRDPRDPWAVKEEMLLEEAIAANVSRAEKKKRYRVVCRTHGIGFAYHARYDGVPVSVPIVAPQGLAILLADAATQTETSEDDASPRFLRSKSLPLMYNLDWP